MSILGTSVLRTEDPKFLTTGGEYIDDHRVDGMVYVAYVRSSMPHALIESIDIADAVDMPGVVGVWTGADIDLGHREPMPFFNQEMTRPRIATDRVRYAGEIVAVVAAESQAQAVDATEMIVVDYEPLEAVIDPEAALAPDAPVLHESVGNNVAVTFANEHKGDPFADCDVVVSQRILNQRLAVCPLEPRGVLASWENGKLTTYSSTQNAHGTKTGVGAVFGLDDDQIRVIAPDVGGGFGAKNGQYPPEILAMWVAKALDRPALWQETRSESMVDLGHGRGQVQYTTIGGDAEGNIAAFHLRVVQDAGAYPEIGGVLPMFTRMMASGVYDIPTVTFESQSVVTNTCPTAAYRGAGRPEATAAIERAIDVYAAEIGMSPVDVRRKNLIPPDAFPFTTAIGTTYDTGDYEEALDRALAAAGYDELRAEQARRREAGDTRQLGIGVSTYVEITNPVLDNEFGSIELLPGGKALVLTGSSAHGQGHHTTFAMIASELTGIDMANIEVRHGDTDEVKQGWGTGGSKSAQNGGSAVREATQTLIEMAREQAANLLEASVDDVTLDTERGAFHVIGTPAITTGWSEVAASAALVPDQETLLAEHVFSPLGSTFPFGAHVSVVEVDTETGDIDIVRHIACDDCGIMVNPLLVAGQVHGGIAQGISQAMWEETLYDEYGNPQSTNFGDYLFPAASEFPSFERIPMETATPINPLGAKGVGESGTIGSTPAVQNAVVDALSTYGIRHIDMPLTPERVWKAIQNS
ncbi:MAG: carbon-monoxide dehydrogenase large subunit [Candidatus Poriferisodalaceae bacterium]|jgi:carbon-monoxide dehydrogenase large subunit